MSPDEYLTIDPQCIVEDSGNLLDYLSIYNDSIVNIQVRIKSKESIALKLRRKPFHQIRDLVGIRILATDRESALSIFQKLKKLPYSNPKDYYTHFSKIPGSNYRAYHLVNYNLFRCPVEIQITTYHQYIINESSHENYKKQLYGQ